MHQTQSFTRHNTDARFQVVLRNILIHLSESQARGHNQNYRYQVGHFSKMTRLPVRFRTCPVVLLLSRPVNKYEVKVHESVGLQERLSLCTCFSLCTLSLPSSLSFPCPKSPAMSREKKIAKIWDTCRNEEDCAQEGVERNCQYH
jgi:hypothetical protein